ncbi:MAG: hypothetical protein ABIO72_00850 [Patescibacteria group bacterium]
MNVEREAQDERRGRQGKSALLLESLESSKRESDERVRLSQESGGQATHEDEVEALISSRHVEIFLREHDSTGAWKGERLGRDLARDMREHSWERDAEGALAITPEDERTHLLFVHMGELDRLNSSGDHSLGDQGLRLTAEKVESIVREVLGRDPSRKDDRRLADAYDVYRHAGNDFAVNLRDVDAESAEEIRRRLAQDPIEIAQVRSGEDPIPVAASRISRADGIHLLNQLDERPEDVGLSNQKVLIQAMIEKAQTLNDIAKVEMRTERMLGKIREAGADPLKESAARDLYDKFLKKSLGDVFKPHDATELADYDAFRRLVTEHRALEVPAKMEWTHLVTERAMGDAFQSLKARRAVGRSIELNLASTVAKEVLAQSEKFGIVFEGEDVPPSSPGFVAPQDTRGKKFLTELDQKTSAFADPSSPDARLAKADADLEKSKRDPRTGIYGRGVYFETMEKGFEEGKEVSTIAIDMAFLKYFDKEGGPGTGDLAVKKAVEVLDAITATFKERGIEINEPYRVGGDEFALTILGADSKVIQEVLAAIREGARMGGRVPATTGASPRYRSEGLQFNYGVRHAQSAEAFRLELESMGVALKDPSDPEATNELTEYLVRLADKEIEIQKGVNRLMMLLDRTLKADEDSNIDMLKAYSQKAIFGAAGEAKLKEFVASVTSSQDQTVEIGRIRGEATRFVISQLDAKNAQVASFESSLDKRLEDAVRIRFFEQRISELETEIDALNARLVTETSNQEVYKQAARAAEEEKQAIVELRSRMRPEDSEVTRPTVRTAA